MSQILYFSGWRMLYSPWLLYTWPDTHTLEHPLCCSWLSLFSTISEISTKFSSNPSLSTRGQNSSNNPRRKRYPNITYTQPITWGFTADFPWIPTGCFQEERSCSLLDDKTLNIYLFYLYIYWINEEHVKKNISLSHNASSFAFLLKLLSSFLYKIIALNLCSAFSKGNLLLSQPGFRIYHYFTRYSC